MIDQLRKRLTSLLAQARNLAREFRREAGPIAGAITDYEELATVVHRYANDIIRSIDPSKNPLASIATQLSELSDAFQTDVVLALGGCHRKHPRFCERVFKQAQGATSLFIEGVERCLEDLKGLGGSEAQHGGP